MTKCQKRIIQTIRKFPICLQGGVWIDEYNLTANNIAGVILEGVSYRNHFFVSVRKRGNIKMPKEKDQLDIFDFMDDGLTLNENKTERDDIKLDTSIPELNNLSVDDIRIRKLTPLECWRLMDFDDEDYHKARQVNSESQLYKQAGNSIVVAVLENIFEEMCK